MIHLLNGVPPRSLFKPYLDVEVRDEKTVLICARESATFANWIPFKRQIEQYGLVQHNNVVLDLAGTKMVDHSVMERLHELEMDFEQAGLTLEVLGLESHQQLSSHPRAARRRRLARIKRVTIVAGEDLEPRLAERCMALGASGYTSIPCHGAGRRTWHDSVVTTVNQQVRIEVVAPPEVAEQILEYIRREVADEHAVTACIETVEVLTPEQF